MAIDRKSYSSVLVLLFLQFTYCAKPIFEQDTQWVYKYSSYIVTKNAASDEHIAEWNVLGKLKIQSAKDHVIMKLDDLQTSLFNGHRADRLDAINKDIPEEAQIISEPFVVHYSKDDGLHKDIHISHLPNEPLWSVNMKRAIASIFQMKEDDKVDKEHKTYEASIYGVCQVTYKVEMLENNKIVDKTINYKTCQNVSDMDWTNVKSHGSHSAVQCEVERSYHYTKKNGQFVIGDVESSANYTYRNMPNVRSSQHALQKQIFNLLEQTDIVDRIDVSKNTEKTTVLFEYPAELDDTFGRNLKEKNQTELVEQFIPTVEEFKNQLQSVPLLNYNIQDNDTVDQMYSILTDLNKDSLNLLSERVFTGENENNTILQQMFLSMLPYTIEMSTITLFKDLIMKDEMNYILIIQMLATFPIYSTPSLELVKELEFLMDIPVKNPNIRRTAFTSFAALVAVNHEKGTITDQMMTDYQEKYMQLFKNAQKYEDRLSYLLSVLNLANGYGKLTLDYILPIACDTNESKYLRSLAMHSFARLSFKITKEDQLYQTVWPIIRNQSEPFDVRIAAMEMLLANLNLISKEHFTNIIDSYSEYQTDIHDRHIQNYIYTKHLILNDELSYKELMTDAIVIKMETMKKHKSMGAWTTGNYYIGYTDNATNFGDSFQTKLVADPTSNTVNLYEFTYNSFAMSADLGTFTVSLVFDGPLEHYFGSYYLDSRIDSFEPFVELLELVLKHSYKLKDPVGQHIELRIFVDNRAVYGVHLGSKENNTNISHDIRSLIISYASISWPISKFNQLVSDLGTPIEIINEVLVVTSKDLIDSNGKAEGDFKYNDLKYRNMWRNSMTLKSYNPIADIDITTYKIINKERLLQLPIYFHKGEYIFKWKPKEDTFSMIADHLIGCYVSEKVDLYCPNCDMFNELPMGEIESLDIKLLPLEVATGMTFNLTRTKCTDDQLYSDDTLKMTGQEMFDLHRANSNTFLLAKPLLYYWHYVNYYTWIVNDLDRISLRSIPFYKEPVENTVEFNISEYIFYENDPFEKIQIDVSVALTNRNIATAKQLSHFNASYQYVSKSESNENNSKLHVEDRHFAQVELTGKEAFKMCIDREIAYPDRRINKYSLVPVEPVKGKTTISWGSLPKDADTCPTDKYIKISEIYSATDEHNQKVKDTKEYKTCKQESVDLKYTPPTDACLKVFEKISEYNLYKFYADFRHSGKLAQAVAALEHTNYGLKLLEIERHIDDSVNYTYSNEFFELFIKQQKLDIVSSETVSNFLEWFRVNPSDESYDDHVIKYGISNNCFITPNNIKTFSGKTISNYYADNRDEVVALIECINHTRAGVTIQRLNDKVIGFTYITEENRLTATVEDGKLRVTHNGTDLQNNVYDVDVSFRVYFLAEDVIYVIDNVLELYYNTEFLLIKTFSMYERYTCGACTYQIEN